MSFFLALGVKPGFLPGLEGPPGEALCFIPWVALTNCVNQACTGPTSKSFLQGDVAGAPVACTPLTGVPNGWRTFLDQWPPRLSVEVLSRHRAHHWPRAHVVWRPNPWLWLRGYLPPILVCTCLVIVKKRGHCPQGCSPSLAPWCN